MLLGALVLAAAVANPPLELHVQRAVIALPTADEAVVTLYGEGREVAAPALRGQRLLLGDVSVPLPAAPELVITPAGSRVTFKVPLRTVGEGVLALDPYAIPVRWEGHGGKAKAPQVVLTGTLDLSDRGKVQLPVDDLTAHYARLADYSATPSGLNVTVHLLLNLYNPFAFEVVATGLQYRLEVGGQEVLASSRPGFRLRALQHSDILVEQDVPLAELASSLAAFMAHQPATLTGVLGIRTPKGERGIPILLQGGM
jgi:hypothetical protein